ncbi:hypothetical protein MSIBF_A1500003 [groundwater metagenome]|uniref:Uncharacterized protein n=1 Tax=groundwater metagenome TaxID=717931 RepID=A0A098E6H1_9ZZZZ
MSGIIAVMVTNAGVIFVIRPLAHVNVIVMQIVQAIRFATQQTNVRIYFALVIREYLITHVLIVVLMILIIIT